MAVTAGLDKALDKAYRAAHSDADHLDVVRKFLRLAPHNALARRRLLALLESLGRGHELLALVSARLEDAAPERRASLAPRARADSDR